MLEARPPALLGCRCPSSLSRHLPWDGSSHPLVWRLPAETISRADVGEVSPMSTHSPNILQVSGCSGDASHGRAVSSHSRISLAILVTVESRPQSMQTADQHKSHICMLV